MARWSDLNRRTLADYITELHTAGKSPSTIAQVVAAAKGLAKNHGIEIVGEITQKTRVSVEKARNGDMGRWTAKECTIDG